MNIQQVRNATIIVEYGGKKYAIFCARRKQSAGGDVAWI